MNNEDDFSRGDANTRMKESLTPPRSTIRSIPFTILDRYDVTGRLGTGGMGDVCLAHDRQLDRPVAVKWIRGDLAQSHKAIQRFYQEAKAAAALNHPNIVQIYDRGRDGGDDFFVMEYVDGESLAERLKRGPLDLDECVRIALAVCDALQAAHDNGIVHRDVKPANIVLTVDGNPKLTDFGVARLGAESEMTMVGSTVGTLAYMAPEQEKDAAGASPKSDQYSFAATLYHMLTGESPARILERRIPDVLRDVIVRGTEPDPTQRFPTMADFKLAVCDATGISTTSVSAQQATGNALDTLKRQKERVRQIHEAARRLAFEQYEWSLGRTTLQQIPESVRDEKLWAEVCCKAERAESLNASIKKAVESMELRGLNLAIDALLELQPNRVDIREMGEVLDPADVVSLDDCNRTENTSIAHRVLSRHPEARQLRDALSNLNDVTQILNLEIALWRERHLKSLSAYLRTNLPEDVRHTAMLRYTEIQESCVSALMSLEDIRNRNGNDSAIKLPPVLTDLQEELRSISLPSTKAANHEWLALLKELSYLLIIFGFSFMGAEMMGFLFGFKGDWQWWYHFFAPGGLVLFFAGAYSYMKLDDSINAPSEQLRSILRRRIAQQYPVSDVGDTRTNESLPNVWRWWRLAATLDPADH